MHAVNYVCASRVLNWAFTAFPENRADSDIHTP
jgi:hypothetical protein